MEELYRLSAGRWDILVSEVEPGSVEHDQGANLAVSVCCDGKPFTAYAYVERRHGEGSWAEDSPPLTEEPDFVGFVLSRRDLQKLEFLLARVHELLQGGNGNPEDRECALGTRGLDGKIVPREPGDNGEVKR